MTQKQWYKSKTIWANVLILAAGLFTELAGLLETGVSIGFVALLNILLRVVTNSGLKK